MFAHAILRKIALDARAVEQFFIIADGTQNSSRQEQLSICLHFVSNNLEPRKEFIGYYQPTDTTGVTIANCVKECTTMIRSLINVVTRSNL